MSDANFGFNSPTSNRYMPVSEANSSGSEFNSSDSTLTSHSMDFAQSIKDSTLTPYSTYYPLPENYEWLMSLNQMDSPINSSNDTENMAKPGSNDVSFSQTLEGFGSVTMKDKQESRFTKYFNPSQSASHLDSNSNDDTEQIPHGNAKSRIVGEERLQVNSNPFNEIAAGSGQMLDPRPMNTSRRQKITPEAAIANANYNYAMELSKIKADILNEIQQSYPDGIPADVLQYLPKTEDSKLFNGNERYNEIQQQILGSLRSNIQSNNQPEKVTWINNQLYASFNRPPEFKPSSTKYGLPNKDKAIRPPPPSVQQGSAYGPPPGFPPQPGFGSLRDFSLPQFPEPALPRTGAFNSGYGHPFMTSGGMNSNRASGFNNQFLMNYYLPPPNYKFPAPRQTPAPPRGNADNGEGPNRGWCPFCKKNGESMAVYQSHNLYQPGTRKVICPVLRRFRCSICGTTGDFAHTRGYCRLNDGIHQKSMDVKPNNNDQSQ